MKIEFPRLGIESIATHIDEEAQYAKITTSASSHITTSADLRLLAREIVAMADELDAASPSQAEIAREMVEEHPI
ncbi:hypothetical protein [Corynebacterium stationis]|uniref:hypothetical protein n=1 Tax=Corynebacterium stationis TaxID=1705 RepID=UPI00322096F7